MAQFATNRRHNGKPVAMSFADATKAYFNATQTRDLFARAPRELGLPSGNCGKLLKCAYGTRDACALWEEHNANVLICMGFAR